MAFRIACDLDGVLADMTGALKRHERELVTPDEACVSRSQPAAAPPRRGLSAAQQNLLWSNVAEIANFWETLAEIEPGCVRSLAELARNLRWEIIFLTKRPRTAGDTAQVQSQRWLERHGFRHPSVFVVHGSRGKIADALALDFVVDDLPGNCVDVLSDSSAKPILVWRSTSTRVPSCARQLGIRVVESMSECLHFLLASHGSARRPTFIDRVRTAIRST